MFGEREGYANIGESTSRYVRQSIGAALIALNAFAFTADEVYQEHEPVYGLQEHKVEQELDKERSKALSGGVAYDDGSLYSRGELSDLSATRIDDVELLRETLEDETTLRYLGELVWKDLQDGEVTLDGVRNLPEGENDSSQHYTVNDLETEFEIAADRTEIGGLVFEEEGMLEFTPFQPRYQASDREYRVSKVMYDVLNTKWNDAVLPLAKDETETIESDAAVAVFHLHAFDEDGNPRFGGPSIDDVMMVDEERLAEPGVLITYLGTDDSEIQINVDYFHAPNGGRVDIIDLGNYSTDVPLR